MPTPMPDAVTLRDEMKRMRWIASFAPVQDIRVIPVPLPLGAPAVATGVLVYQGSGLTIMELRPRIDVDPNLIANPQNTHILVGASEIMDLPKCKQLYRHFSDEFIAFVPDGQTWWAIAVGAPGALEMTIRTVMPIY